MPPKFEFVYAETQKTAQCALPSRSVRPQRHPAVTFRAHATPFRRHVPRARNAILPLPTATYPTLRSQYRQRILANGGSKLRLPFGKIRDAYGL